MNKPMLGQLQPILSTSLYQEIQNAIGSVVNNGDTSLLEALISNVERSLKKNNNAVDAAKMVFSYWVVAAIAAVYQCGAAYVSPRSFVALAVILAYAVLPDLFPGPVDDTVFILLATQYVGATVDFAKWITQQSSPPAIPGLSLLPPRRRKKLEKWLWETARNHARRLLGNDDPEKAIEQSIKTTKETQRQEQNPS